MLSKSDRIEYTILFWVYAVALAGLALLGARLGFWPGAVLAAVGSLLTAACAGETAGGGKS